MKKNTYTYKYINIYTYESLCYILETDTTL